MDHNFSHKPHRHFIPAGGTALLLLPAIVVKHNSVSLSLLVIVGRYSNIRSMKVLRCCFKDIVKRKRDKNWPRFLVEMSLPPKKTYYADQMNKETDKMVSSKAL